MARSSRNVVRVPRGVGSISRSSQLVWSLPLRRACWSAASRRRRTAYGWAPSMPGDWGGRGGRGRARRQVRHVGLPGVLLDGQAHGLPHRLGGEGQVAGGLLAVVAVPVPAPGGQVQGVTGTPADALPVDLGPGLPGHAEHHRVPGVPVHGADHAGVDLVGGGVHGPGRPSAVGPGVDAAAHPAAGLVHLDVLDRHDRPLVGPPLLDEVGAPLLLHVVVGDLGGGPGAHGSPYLTYGAMLLELATAEATWLVVAGPEMKASGSDSLVACFRSAGRAAAFTNAWRRADTVAAGVPGGAAKSSDRPASALASLSALVWPADTDTWDSSESRVGTPDNAFCQVGRDTD